MLGKLFKYDMLSLSRILGILHGAALLAGLLALAISLAGTGVNTHAFTGAGLGSDNTLLALFVLFAFFACVAIVFLMASLMLANLILVARRFFNNLYSDEGYLTLTLPVTANQVVLAKSLAGAVWVVVDYVVVSFGIASAGYGLLVFGGILSTGHSLAPAFLGMGVSPGDVGSWFLGLLQVLTEMLVLFASISIGAAAARHKVAASIGVYLLVGLVFSVFSGIADFVVYSMAPLAPVGYLGAARSAPQAALGVVACVIALVKLGLSYAVCYFRVKNRVNLA